MNITTERIEALLKKSPYTPAKVIYCYKTGDTLLLPHMKCETLSWLPDVNLTALVWSGRLQEHDSRPV